MKKFKRIASLISTLVLGAAAVSSFAQTNDNWMSSTGIPWKNGTNEYCWRDANWTPATAYALCDGAIKPAAPAVVVRPPPPPPPPVSKAAPVPPPPVVAPAPPPPPVPAAPTSEKVTYAADTFFDFDKSVLKPAGKAKLDDLVEKTRGIDLEAVIATGHTDWVGTDAYNQALSIRRAEAVKAYLVGKGVEKSKIFTEGKGEKQPAADNRTRAGRAQNRRVVIETVGTRTINK